MNTAHLLNNKDLGGPLSVEITIRPGRGILFVDSQGLGDVVQSLPLLRAICRWADRRWPVRALFATADHYQLVREEKLNVTPFFVSSVPRKLTSGFHAWRQLVGRSDLIVCAPEISAAKLSALRFATGARYAIGEGSTLWDRFLTVAVESSWVRPWTETQDAIAAALGIEIPLEAPSIAMSQLERCWARSKVYQSGIDIDTEGSVLGVQCSSVVRQKSWPAERFGKVIREMHRRHPGLHVISFGNRAERPSARLAHCFAGEVPWLEGAGEWEIRQTLAMLRCCDLFLSGDTGLMHMAAAVGTPTVSIFGPTSAVRRAPQNGGIAVCPFRSCYPCFRGAWTPCDCIQSITVERVISAVDQLLLQTIPARPRRQNVSPELATAEKH